MRHYLTMLITAAIVCSAQAASAPYSISSKAQGASFDLVVTETKRESNKIYLSVPGFHNRTAAGARWLMCVYTDLAVIHGFANWIVSYPPDGSDVLVVGLSNSSDASAKEVLGKDYSVEHTLGDELVPVEKLFTLCGMHP